MNTDEIHPDSPWGAGGPGFFKQAGALDHISPAGSSEPHPRSPSAKYAGDPRPGLGDQWNPLNSRNSDPRDYTKWFETRFPHTIAGSKDKLRERITDWIVNHCSERPETAPPFQNGEDDIDIAPDMKRFGDEAEGFYERWARIGYFELKTDAVVIRWQDSDFSFVTTMYVAEQTGATFHEGDLTALAAPFCYKRVIRMGEWEIRGSGTCKARGKIDAPTMLA